jgi:hypothetical protein
MTWDVKVTVELFYRRVEAATPEEAIEKAMLERDKFICLDSRIN